MSLKYFGLEAFRRAVTQGVALAEHAEAILREDLCWEGVTPVLFGIVTFRYTSAGKSSAALDSLNLQLIEEMIASGFAMLSSTTLRNRIVLRFCTINPRTTEVDLRETIQRLKHIGDRLSSQQIR